MLTIDISNTAIAEECMIGAQKIRESWTQFDNGDINAAHAVINVMEGRVHAKEMYALSRNVRDMHLRAYVNIKDL